MTQVPENDLYDMPLEVQAFEGAVVLTGPDGVALSLTPRAAVQSAELLIMAAAQALEPK
jgi:hypothetical protein